MEGLQAHLAEQGLDASTVNKDSWPRILALKKVQLEQDKLMEEYSRRRYELFLEFQQKAEPLLEKRKGLVTGTAEAEPEEGAGDAGAGAEGEPSGAADAAATEATSAEATPTKGVPGFWLAALKNHSVAGSFVMEHDIPALKHLVDVRSATLPEGKGFKLTFEFLENEFFTNSVLTKTYFVDNLWTDMSEPDLVKVEATAVDWKPGKNLTVETVTVKPKKKGRKAQGPKTVTRSRPSFFAFFTPFNLDEDEEEEHEGEDDEDEAAHEKFERLQMDFHLGTLIHSNLLPNAVDWYVGDVEESDDEFEGEGDDEDEDEDDEDGDDEKDKLVFDFSAPTTTAPGGATEGGDAKPECQQQ